MTKNLSGVYLIKRFAIKYRHTFCKPFYFMDVYIQLYTPGQHIVNTTVDQLPYYRPVVTVTFRQL